MNTPIAVNSGKDLANPSLAQAQTNIAGQLALSSRRIYKNDALHFVTWMKAQGLEPSTFTREDMIAYRLYLDTTASAKTGKPYSKATKQRMFVVATSLMKEQYASGVLSANVTERVKGFKAGNDETTHTALSKTESIDLLKSIDTSTLAGKRNYAILLMLLKTGLRRAEIVALDRKDLRIVDGHHVAVVKHGKGDKQRLVKLRTEVFKAVRVYLEALPEGTKDSPLFIRIRKGDKPVMTRLTGEAIEDIVKKYAPDESELTPHGLRATYATIALESGAPLEQVQYSMGHSDPRTTERYQRRKLNLDNNAVDYLNF
jgi:site-specific recombinase XerD